MDLSEGPTDIPRGATRQAGSRRRVEGEGQGFCGESLGTGIPKLLFVVTAQFFSFIYRDPI